MGLENVFVEELFAAVADEVWNGCVSLDVYPYVVFARRCELTVCAFELLT
jgi:hypothetical protein